MPTKDTNGGGMAAIWKVATAASLLLGAGAFGWAWDMRADFAVVVDNLKDLKEDNARVEALEETRGKHWRRLSWSKDQINELRRLHDLSVETWTGLD